MKEIEWKKSIPTNFRMEFVQYLRTSDCAETESAKVATTTKKLHIFVLFGKFSNEKIEIIEMILIGKIKKKITWIDWD